MLQLRLHIELIAYHYECNRDYYTHERICEKQDRIASGDQFGTRSFIRSLAAAYMLAYDYYLAIRGKLEQRGSLRSIGDSNI